ncbi:MAG: heavy metal-associated domain-containing protein [Chloroflexota bacterium]|nr:heavy metal-associated domain-containing protein [Chloroflexota bacterium]
MKWSALQIRPSRLRTAPRLRTVERGEGHTTFAVDGLVCGMCAARTRSALSDVEGVRGVDVDLERGVAVVRHDDDPPRMATMQRAVDGVVIALPVRRLLDRLTHRRGRGERTTA